MARPVRHAEYHVVNRLGWLRAAVLGANDGILSTSSLIIGVASAQGSHQAVLIAGVSGLVAGAMSPVDELAHGRVGEQAVHINPMPLQFGVGEVGCHRLLADRVHRHDVTAAPALGHGMVPDDGLTDRAAAEPARRYGYRRLILAR